MRSCPSPIREWAVTGHKGENVSKDFERGEEQNTTTENKSKFPPKVGQIFRMEIPWNGKAAHVESIK